MTIFGSSEPGMTFPGSSRPGCSDGRTRTREDAPAFSPRSGRAVIGHAADGLAPGQVGTVVEVLDAETFLVEFSDDEGRAYALTPCRGPQLLVLRYAPEAA